MKSPVSVATKKLTGKLNPLDATLTKNRRGGVCYAHPTRMRILSDHRESKDSSPVPLFAHSLHKECFTTLLQSSASALFLKTAGCIPTIPFWNSLPARTGASIDTRGEAEYLSAPMESLAKRR